MINQIPTFAGLEDAVIAMIGGLSLFFFRSKDGKTLLLEWEDLEKKFLWGLIFFWGRHGPCVCSNEYGFS